MNRKIKLILGISAWTFITAIIIFSFAASCSQPEPIEPEASEDGLLLNDNLVAIKEGDGNITIKNTETGEESLMRVDGVFVAIGQKPENEPFSDAGGHYSKVSAGHPFHSGDLPPLFGNDGYAWYAVLTDRFSIEDIIGRTVIIHADPDDFTSQPSGKSGKRIACGVVLAKT